MSDEEPRLDVERTFWDLCDQAEQVIQSTGSADRFESSLLSVLNWIRRWPEKRGFFASAFVTSSLGTGRPVSPEVVEYCLRELRWPEVKSSLVTAMPDLPPRIQESAKSVLEVFEPAWDGDVIYQRFSKT